MLLDTLFKKLEDNYVFAILANNRSLLQLLIFVRNLKKVGLDMLCQLSTCSSRSGAGNRKVGDKGANYDSLVLRADL